MSRRPGGFGCPGGRGGPGGRGQPRGPGYPGGPGRPAGDLLLGLGRLERQETVPARVTRANPYSPGAHWVHCQAGQVPAQAVQAGRDVGGELLYVCRAFHEGDTIPGKLVPSHGVAYVSRDCKEHKKDCYEVLSGGRLSWASGSHGQVPHNALAAGQTVQGETLYVGRFHHAGSLTPGKVHPSHGCCYIPYGGIEVKASVYEVLVVQ